MSGDPRDYRGDPRDYRGDPRDYRGDPRDYRGDPRDYRGDSRDYRGDSRVYRGDSRDYRGDYPRDSRDYRGDYRGESRDYRGDSRDYHGDHYSRRRRTEYSDRRGDRSRYDDSSHSHRYYASRYTEEKRRRFSPESYERERYSRYYDDYDDGDEYRNRSRGPKPDAGDDSRRRDPEQPGPSWAGQSEQPPRFQQQQQQQQQQSQSKGEQSEAWDDEAAGGGDFNARMSSLNVQQREDEDWDQVPGRRGGRSSGAWKSQSQQSHQQRPAQPQQQYHRQQAQPSFQQQPRAGPSQSQSRPQPQQSHTVTQPRPEQQVAPGATGAWAKGPPQELHRSAQEKPKQTVAEKPTPPPMEVDQPYKKEHGKSRKTIPESHQADFLDFAPRIFATHRNGRSIDVNANFFMLRLQDYNITVYHYDIVFDPEIPKSLIRRAWNIAADVHFPRRITVFDGMSNVYTRGALIDGLTFRAEMTILHPDTAKSRDYTLMIKEVRRISMNSLSNYREKLKQSQTIEDRKKALPLAELSVIEVILKNWPANNLIQHNRVFFPKLEVQPRTCLLSDRLELRYGYFQSAFLGYKLYLNFDVAHRPFYKSDYLKNLIRDLNQGRLSGDSDDTNHYLKGAKIEYTLPDDRNMKMVYRANKLVSDALSQSFDRDGLKMTVAEYFQKEKDFKLRYPHLPLLWVGPSTKTIYLPLELVKLAEDQIYRGALNSNETRKMVSGATTDARKRKRETVEAFTNANFHDNPFLKEFGILISREMESVKARVLEPPKLRTNTVITVKEGAWKSRAFVEAKSFNKWCILNLDKTVNRNSLINLQKSLQSKAREFNMPIGEPAMIPVDRGGTISYFELQKIFSQLKGMTIVIVVISDVKGLYSKVKTICETQEGILTQCIRGKNISMDPRRIMTTLDNLLLKINAKLGGTNHALNQSSIPHSLQGYVMVIGADVTHAGPGSKIPSVAAVAVSCEVSAFQYGITIRVQNGEIIQDLKEIMRINLYNFAKIRKVYPDKIFFFRDGVSEGEMEKVLKVEYRAVKEACDAVNCSAKVTLLVVQKRHHTRFFPTSPSDEEGKTFNVPVGTCVDSDIVQPGGLDFYLLSHGSLLGTARPTRYRLLHDDNRLTDDELEHLTFYLCHLYSRCNRSVSYPSPTYNAHLAAFRARAYLEGLNLTDKDDLKQVQAKLKDAISANYPMFFV